MSHGELDILRPSLQRIESALRESVASLADRDGVQMPERLRAAIEHTLLAGGKRLRPLLVLESARAAAADGDLRARSDELAMPAALAVEYVHTYSLIHDDLPALDNDDLRRGRPTLHVLYDEATAILAGDALLTDAFSWASRVAHRPAEVCRELAQAAGSAGMVGGQLDDLLGEGRALDADALRAIHARKTGRLFRACCVMGAHTTLAAAPHIDALDRYAAALGLAFQIADDVLDVVGDVEARGKRQGGDVDNDKSTYVRAYGLEGARAAAEACVAEAIDALAPLGDAGATLAALARYTTARTR